MCIYTYITYYIHIEDCISFCFVPRGGSGHHQWRNHLILSVICANTSFLSGAQWIKGRGAACLTVSEKVRRRGGGGGGGGGGVGWGGGGIRGTPTVYTPLHH